MSRPLRIATYNIRKALGTDRRRDPERVMRVIAELGADILCLQEADKRLPPRPPALERALLEERTGLRPVEYDHGRDSLGWHGNAILIGPDIEVTDRVHHDFPGLEPRGMVEAVLERDGIPFRVFGVHLALMRAVRKRQVRHLLDRAGDADLPTLIAGDFNERSLGEGLGSLARHYRILTGGPTYHSRRPVFGLDRIAISDHFDAGEIGAVMTEDRRLASDHLPLLAEVSLG